MRKSFTLIELMVVIGIIILLSAISLGYATSMWDEAHSKTAHSKIANLLKVARIRSQFSRYDYGLIFFVNPDRQQTMAFIVPRTIPDTDENENWIDVCDRFEIDPDNRQLYELNSLVRVVSVNSLDWGMTDIRNNSYRTDKHRNFFAIIFRNGKRKHGFANSLPPLRPIILYDADENDDGFGDQTLLPVEDVRGETNGDLPSTVSTADGERFEFPLERNGVVTYNETIFQEDTSLGLDDVRISWLGITDYAIVRGD